MKVSIMQPYFLPYIGYWQLIHSADIFVVYDNIEFTKKGWINRNRMLVNGKPKLFTVDLKKHSDFCMVNECEISKEFNSFKFLVKIKEAYRKAPYFDETFAFFEKYLAPFHDLFSLIYTTILAICSYLEIKTTIVRSSSLILPDVKKNEKVKAICKLLEADTYINAIGGQALYTKSEFYKVGIDLYFIKTNPIVYKQFNNEFVPWLSILDVLMFNGREGTMKLLPEYTLI